MKIVGIKMIKDHAVSGILDTRNNQFCDLLHLIRSRILHPDNIAFPKGSTLKNMILLYDERPFFPFFIAGFVREVCLVKNTVVDSVPEQYAPAVSRECEIQRQIIMNRLTG